MRYALLIMGTVFGYSVFSDYSRSRSGHSSSSERQAKTGNKLRIFSLAADWTPSYHYMLRSMESNQLPVQVVIAGRDSDSNWVAVGSNLGVWSKAIHRYRTHSDQLVILANGHNFLFNANVDQLATRFKQFNAKIVFSAERTCKPEDFQPRFVLVDDNNNLSVNFIV